MKKFGYIALVAVVALALQGCGGGDGDSYTPWSASTVQQFMNGCLSGGTASSTQCSCAARELQKRVTETEYLNEEIRLTLGLAPTEGFVKIVSEVVQSCR